MNRTHKEFVCADRWDLNVSSDSRILRWTHTHTHTYTHTHTHSNKVFSSLVSMKVSRANLWKWSDHTEGDQLSALFPPCWSVSELSEGSQSSWGRLVGMKDPGRVLTATAESFCCYDLDHTTRARLAVSLTGSVFPIHRSTNTDFNEAAFCCFYFPHKTHLEVSTEMFFMLWTQKCVLFWAQRITKCSIYPHV